MENGSSPSMSARLEGKVALITGGARGIGECTARLFVQNGAKVVIADLQDSLGHSVCKELGPENATYVHCDVTDESQVSKAVDTAVNTFGKLDIMFNNAGITDDLKPRIIDNEKVDFERVLRVNITGVFLGVKHAARVMVPARTGCIISTASISSVTGDGGTHAYTCSKHAIAGLTKSAAAELGQFGIRANCVSPFGIATPFVNCFTGQDDDEFENEMNSIANLKGVTLKPLDVAKAVLYLASDDARYVSGHNLIIDGGVTVANPLFGMFRYPENS